jgi:dienelactone hydrolase
LAKNRLLFFKPSVSIPNHSWGGSVAALYATKFPDKIARLVLFAPVTERQDATIAASMEGSYETMTPAQRITAMKNLTPPGAACQLHKAIFETWGSEWLQSDPLAGKFNADSVRFPSGFAQDLEDLSHGQSYYSPAAIKAPTLLIRGEWDDYPNNTDAETLFRSLDNAVEKKYVVIAAGTHVMHLEKNRFQLYDEVLHFLQSKRKIQATNSHPIAVIFEVIPADSAFKQEYLQIAANLKRNWKRSRASFQLSGFKVFIILKKYYPCHSGQMKRPFSNGETWRYIEMPS